MRYIIIEKKLGVFVGQFDVYAVYAKNEIFGLERVVSFADKKTAVKYIEEFLNKEDREFAIEAIDSKNKYVSIKDIIKTGFGEHTHKMMDNIEMQSLSVH